MSLVAPDDDLTILAIMLAMLPAAMALGHTRLGKILPTPALMLLGAALMANLRVMPDEAKAYKEVGRLAVPLGVFLLLLRANLREVWREGKAIVGVYLIGAMGSIVGIALALVLIPIPEALKSSAALVGSLVGGTANKIAVAHAVQLPAFQFAALAAAGAIAINVYLTGLPSLERSGWIRRWLGSRREASSPGAEPSAPAPASEAGPRAPFDALGFALMVACAFASYVVSDAILSPLGGSQYTTLLVTLIALAAANMLPGRIARLAGDREVGMLAMNLFFASLGFTITIADFGLETLATLAFTILAILIHLAIIIALGRVMKADAAETLVASVAAIGGPATAAAMAAAFGRPALITPGILCGLLGFAIATFAGLAFFALGSRLM